MAFLPNEARFKSGKLIGIYLTAVFGPNLAITYSWASANFAGHTKKVTINAIALMAYGASSIIGPLTFTGASAPNYIPAKVTILVALAVSVVLTLILMGMYKWENNRRDKWARETGYVHQPDIEFMDLTDKQNPEFRYAL